MLVLHAQVYPRLPAEGETRVDEEEVQAKLLLEASEAGLDADEAEFLVAEAMKYSEILERKMPGAAHVFEGRRVGPVFDRCFSKPCSGRSKRDECKHLGSWTLRRRDDGSNHLAKLRQMWHSVPKREGS